MNLNYISPINNIVRNIGRDVVGVISDVGFKKLTVDQAMPTIANIMIDNVKSLTLATASLKNALKTDTASRVEIADALKEGTSMKRDLQDAVVALEQAIKSKNYPQAMKHMAKIMWTSTDAIRRLLSSADEMYAHINFNTSVYNQGRRALATMAKMPHAEIDKLIEIAHRQGEQQAREIINEHNTKDKDQQKLIYQEQNQLAFLDAVRVAVDESTDGEVTDINTQIFETADNETSTDSGNRPMEEAPDWDIVNNVLNIAIKMSQASRAKGNELLGRILTGFVTVPAHIFNRSAYYTPYGFLRAYAQERSISKEDGNKFYDHTMKNDQQIRLRKIEASIGTFGMGLMAFLMSAWKDDEDEPVINITGQGSADKAQLEADKKAGFPQNSLTFKIGDKRVAVRVIEGLNIPVAFLSAIDDMKRNGKTRDKLTAEWVGEFSFTAMRNLAKQASFMNPKSPIATLLSPQASGRTTASSVAGIVTNLIPFSGFIRSMDKIIMGPKDQSSMKAALIANTPIAGTLGGNEALNFLGDNVNLTPENFAEMMSDRFYQAGVPVFLGDTKSKKHDDIYSFIRDTGITPTIPNRGSIEKQYGYFTEDGWMNYIKTRGAILADLLSNNLDKMRDMDESKANAMMEKLDSNATKIAKDKVGLKKLALIEK